MPGPPKPVVKVKRSRKQTPPALPVSTAPLGPSAEAARPNLRLGPLLSDADQRAYNAAVDASITKAEHNIASAEAKGLSASQQDMIRQVRNFIAQAQEVRSKDLPAAKSLAERAEIVSREVAGAK
jgi:hypothetical protein